LVICLECYRINLLGRHGTI